MSGSGSGTPVSGGDLTVEDGTGLADADAFVSVADCDAYHDARATTAWTDEPSSPPEAKEAAIRRATAWLSNSFAWKGTRLNGRDQALAWPREDVEDAEGEEVASDVVPIEVVHATCEAAAYELANPGGLNPNVDLTARIRSEQIGPMRTEYAFSGLSAEAARPVLLAVRGLISGLLSSGSNPLVGTAVRG